MAVFDNLNKSTSSGVAPSVVSYHEKTLLKNMKPQLVHCRDLETVALPSHNGRKVQFRRPTPFSAITKPLEEGVTPAGQSFAMTDFTATIRPYGGFVELTDEINWALLDDVQRMVNEQLADQAALSVDNIARDALHAGLNVQYAGGKTARSAIAAADKLTYAEIKKAVRALKKANCRPFPDGFYHAIVDPDTVYDLTSDTMWVDVAKYQDKQKVERNELGCIYKVKFFESTEAKVFKTQSYVCGTSASLTISAVSADKMTLTLSAALTEGEARELTGKLVMLRAAVSSANYDTPVCVMEAEGKTVKLRFTGTSTETARWVTTNTLTLIPTGGGASGAEVHSTLVYGAKYAGCVQLDGTGKNVQVIIKPAGSSGALDPLNQRGTIGWKVKGFTTVILQDAFVVRIEHGVTA
ncbi:MAG: N4-gp56 family major capsid protein [Eubacteriales bacterium]|nr:N4-gp56 family major capsid protein [Eubacteriales bacterium]